MKNYNLYWWDEVIETSKTAFEAENDKVAVNIANHFIEYYDMKNPQLYEVGYFYSKSIKLLKN